MSKKKRRLYGPPFARREASAGLRSDRFPIPLREDDLEERALHRLGDERFAVHGVAGEPLHRVFLPAIREFLDDDSHLALPLLDPVYNPLGNREVSAEGEGIVVSSAEEHRDAAGVEPLTLFLDETVLDADVQVSIGMDFISLHCPPSGANTHFSLTKRLNRNTRLHLTSDGFDVIEPDGLECGLHRARLDCTFATDNDFSYLHECTFVPVEEIWRSLNA